MAVIVRERRDDDAERLLRIVERVHAVDGYPPYLPDGDFRAFLFGHETLGAWVAELGGQPVGQVALHPRTSPDAMRVAAAALGVVPERLAVVARLFVSPDHRRCGAARELLQTAATCAVARNLVPILDVAAGLAGAITVYEQAGWVRAGSVRACFPNGEVVHEHVYLAPCSLRPMPPA